MKGAINIIKGWREICKKHSSFIDKEKTIERHYCKNCELFQFCFSKFPSDRTDEDILDLVNKIGGVNNVNKKH